MKKKQENEEKKKVNLYKLYKENPLVKPFIKLFLYFMMFFIIIFVVSVVPDRQAVDETDFKDSDVQEILEKPYKDILNETLNNKRFNYEILVNGVEYVINYTIEDKVINGIYETTNDVIKKFSIKNDEVYEIALNKEKLNMELFQELNMDYINIYKLVELLSSSKGLKMLEDGKTVYVYNFDEGITIHVNVEAEKVNRILITGNELSYVMTLD